MRRLEEVACVLIFDKVIFARHAWLFNSDVSSLSCRRVFARRRFHHEVRRARPEGRCAISIVPDGAPCTFGRRKRGFISSIDLFLESRSVTCGFDIGGERLIEGIENAVHVQKPLESEGVRFVSFQ